MKLLNILLIFTSLLLIGLTASAEVTDACKTKLWPLVRGLAQADGYDPATIKETGGSLEIFDFSKKNIDGSTTYFARYTYTGGYSNYSDYALTGDDTCLISTIKIIYL